MKIPIVNEQDEILGYKDRDGKNREDISRITALWLTDFDGNVLLAQRAFNKKRSPGLWGPAVAGTVEEGETYEEKIKSLEEIENKEDAFEKESMNKISFLMKIPKLNCKKNKNLCVIEKKKSFVGLTLRF